MRHRVDHVDSSIGRSRRPHDIIKIISIIHERQTIIVSHIHLHIHPSNIFCYRRIIIAIIITRQELHVLDDRQYRRNSLNYCVKETIIKTILIIHMYCVCMWYVCGVCGQSFTRTRITLHIRIRVSCMRVVDCNVGVGVCQKLDGMGDVERATTPLNIPECWDSKPPLLPKTKNGAKKQNKNSTHILDGAKSDDPSRRNNRTIIVQSWRISHFASECDIESTNERVTIFYFLFTVFIVRIQTASKQHLATDKKKTL